jgi:hypothetical protein
MRTDGKVPQGPDRTNARRGGRKQSLPQGRGGFPEAESEGASRRRRFEAQAWDRSRQGTPARLEGDPQGSVGRQGRCRIGRQAGIAPFVERPGRVPEGASAPDRTSSRSSEGPAPGAREGGGDGRLRPDGSERVAREASASRAVRRLKDRSSLRTGAAKGGRMWSLASHVTPRGGRSGFASVRSCERIEARACSCGGSAAEDRGSPRHEVANGSKRGACSSRMIRRRRIESSLSGRSCERAEAGSLLPAEVRRRKDRGSPRYEVANGSKRGACSSRMIRRRRIESSLSGRSCERAEAGSLLPAEVRRRKDRSSLRDEAARGRGCERLLSTLCPCGRRGRELAPESGDREGDLSASLLVDGAPGGEDRAFRARFEPTKGEGVGPRSTPDPGDGTRRGSPRIRPASPESEKARAFEGFGNGERADGPRPCPDPQGTAQAFTAWTGPTGTGDGIRCPSVPAHPAGDGRAEARRS